MAVLTDKQMKYAIYGAIGIGAYLYLFVDPKKVITQAGNAVLDVTIGSAEKFGQDLASARLTQAEQEFLMQVRAQGVTPLDDEERKLALSYRPAGSDVYDALSFIGGGLVVYYYADQAAEAIKKKRTFNQWGIK